MATLENYLKQIAAYDREFKKWQGRVDKIIKRYRDDGRNNITGNSQTRFNILWSNVQTLTAATFAKLPKPDVSRRFKDNDPVGRIASLILERALDYEIQHYSDYGSTLRYCVNDRFLGGRATAWIRYEPHMQAMQLQLPTDGTEITEDIDTPGEELDYECTPCDYVHWKDFGHTVARTWEEVPMVWRKIYMRRPALVERFGEELGNKIPLDAKPDKDQRESTIDDFDSTALIYEIWDKDNKKAVWLSKSMNQIIDERDDPLDLEDFFPCPKPIYATLTNETLVPVPDFILYQDQANELDILSDRIDGLVKALQVKGVYDASEPTLARLFTEGDNNALLPVKNWQSFAEKQGLSGAIDILDIKPIAEALMIAYQAMEQIKGQIFEISGIADIVRGQSDPNETATAQQLKGQYGSLRLKTAQDEVARFATELLRMKAQIICQKYDPQTILKISAAEQLNDADKPMILPALQLLKDNPLRSFRVDVSSDSLVYLDEQQEKQDRSEFLNAAGGFIKEAVNAGGQAPELIPLMVEMLKFGVAGFKVGKTIEGQFDEAAEKLKQAAMQPKPNPELQKAQMDMQQKQQELQAKHQADMMTLQVKAQLDQQAAQTTAQLEAHKQQLQAQQIQQQNQVEAQREQLAAQSEAKLEQMRILHETALEANRQQFELLIARMENATKIEVAEAANQTTLQTAQINSANQAEDSNG